MESTFEWRKKTWTVKGPGPLTRKRINSSLRQRYLDGVWADSQGKPIEYQSQVMREARLDVERGKVDGDTAIGTEIQEANYEWANAVLLWAIVGIAHPEFTLAMATEIVKDEAAFAAANAALRVVCPVNRDPQPAAPIG